MKPGRPARPHDDASTIDPPSVGISWHAEAACHNHPDPEIFHPMRAGAAYEQEAKRICRLSCPVRAQCAQWACEVNDRWGIWGGMNLKERYLWWNSDPLTRAQMLDEQRLRLIREMAHEHQMLVLAYAEHAAHQMTPEGGS